MEPRVTTDIDVIIVVENISHEFGERFWQFIKEGNYKPSKRVNKGEIRYTMYRFRDPKPCYPIKIELLSRHSEILGPPSGYHIEPIPIDEDLSSLSAIIMNDAFYEMTVKRSVYFNGLKIASPETLMALKSRAYLNLLDERASGRQVNSKDIKKHRSDVLKLAAVTEVNAPIVVHPYIHQTVIEFANKIRAELPCRSLEASLNSTNESILIYLDALESSFTPEENESNPSI